MTDTELRIKVAELVGWTGITYHEIGSPLFRYNPHYHADWYGKSPNPRWGGLNPIPDYPNDLNAIHEAVMSLSDDDLARYDQVLWWQFRDMSGRNGILHATARQRAEAFVAAMEAV